MISEYERIIVEPLEKHGVPYTIEYGGKHKAIVWGGHRYPIAATPSDAKGALVARTDINRILKNDGVIRGRPLEPVVLFGDEPEADTRDVAEWFDKNHADVLKATRALRARANGDTRVRISEFLSSDLTGVSVSHYLLNRTAFTLLVMGFTGQKAFEWKLAYISAFDRMEDYIRRDAASERRAMVDQNNETVLRLTSSEERVCVLEDRVSRLTEDLEASIALQLEQQPIIIIRKAPFVRPSLKRKYRNV